MAQEEMDELLKDEVMLRAVRGLCPDGKRVTSVEVSSGGRKVMLTVETRKRIDARLRELKEAKRAPQP